MLVRCPQRNYTSCKLGIGHIDKVFIIITIISRIQHPLIVRRGKLVLQCKIFALRHPNNCVFFSVCEFHSLNNKKIFQSPTVDMLHIRVLRKLRPSKTKT